MGNQWAECPRCHVRWTSFTLCHCATCHVCFTDIEAFDYHRRNEKCLLPEEIKVLKGQHKGKPRLIPSDRVRMVPEDTPVWKRNDFRENVWFQKYR